MNTQQQQCAFNNVFPDLPTEGNVDEQQQQQKPQDGSGPRRQQATPITGNNDTRYRKPKANLAAKVNSKAESKNGAKNKRSSQNQGPAETKGNTARAVIDCPQPKLKGNKGQIKLQDIAVTIPSLLLTGFVLLECYGCMYGTVSFGTALFRRSPRQ